MNLGLPEISCLICKVHLIMSQTERMKWSAEKRKTIQRNDWLDNISINGEAVSTEVSNMVVKGIMGSVQGITEDKTRGEVVDLIRNARDFLLDKFT